MGKLPGYRDFYFNIINSKTKSWEIRIHIPRRIVENFRSVTSFGVDC